MSEGVLYLSYDGMLEPLGQSQVLSYLERLAKNRRIHLISFEKPADWSDDALRSAVDQRIRGANIRWHPLRYHKRPSALATAFDIAHGSARAVAIARKHRLSIVHARSYVAGLMALTVKRAAGAKFLFDMRGFWADERVDGGIWPRESSLFRMAKRVERSLLTNADHIVTLTNASAEELRRFDYLRGRMLPLSVIPTCADLDRFRIAGPRPTAPFTLGYVGSVGTWYMLDEMLRCFALVREQRPGARLLIVNRNDQALVRDRAAALGIGAEALELVAANHAEVPQWIGRMSAGMALYKPSYSRIACAPTKLAEYLACGVPCLGSAGVGDMAALLEGRGVGSVVRDVSSDGLRGSVGRLVELTEMPDIKSRCRAVAEDLFSLASGVEAYDAAYRELGSR